MHRLMIKGAVVGVALLATAAFAFSAARERAPRALDASSHREAPFTSKDPQVDNTDVYAFVSPDKPNTVTLIANYIGLQEPAGGPNFFEFSDDVLYTIHVDNDGDGRSNVDFEFRFRTQVRNPNSFLYNTGPITSLSDPDWNRPQTYTVTRVDRPGSVAGVPAPVPGQSTQLGANLPVPPVNIGPRSTPNYDALAAAAVRSLGGGRMVFAGQRDDPFYVDLGSVFDLLGLRPFNGAHAIPLATAPGVDAVDGYNVHTIAIQVPITDLTRDGAMPSGPTDPKAVIGVYASASRQTSRIFTPDGGETQTGPFVQLSRLGNPLINEVLIGMGQKDRWNRQSPAGDEQFLQRYTNPEPAALINALYPSLPDIPTSGRADLVAVLLTGVPGLNFTGDTKADLLRLNVAIPPSGPVGSGNRLGVLAPTPDLAGFPNGRRLEDDVVDIELRAVACGYGAALAMPPFNLCNLTPNNQLGDGVDKNDKPLLTSFPYLAAPHQGYAHAHDHD